MKTSRSAMLTRQIPFTFEGSDYVLTGDSLHTAAGAKRIKWLVDSCDTWEQVRSVACLYGLYVKPALGPFPDPLGRFEAKERPDVASDLARAVFGVELPARKPSDHAI